MLIKPATKDVKLIINLQEVYDIRDRKQQELEYYNRDDGETGETHLLTSGGDFLKGKMFHF